MKTKLILATVLAAALGLTAVASASGAFVAIYRNALETTPQRSEVRKLAGKSCTRGGARTALKITVGKLTEECSYRTPVIGRDLEIAATGRIMSDTPKRAARKAFLAMQLRVGGGNKLELRVFPAQKKVQIAKVTGEGIHYLAIEKNVEAVQPLEKANVLRLRVVNAAKAEAGTCKISGYLAGDRVIEARDDTCAAELGGELTALAAGAPNNGSGVVASFEAIVVRTPVRF